MGNWRLRGFLTSLLVLLLMATAWGHGGGLNQYGCHNDNIRGGYHCHRGGDEDEPLPFSLNFLAGVRPVQRGQYSLSVVGLVGIRRAPVVGLPEDDMHWRANYGGVVGIQFASLFAGCALDA